MLDFMESAVLEIGVKAIADYPAFYFDARTGRYHKQVTHAMVAFDTIVHQIAGKESVDLNRLFKLTKLYQSGELPAGVWHASMLDMLRKYHLQCAAVGAGGFSKINLSDFKRIEVLLSADSDRLIKFGKQLLTMGDGQLQHRLGMYLGNGRINLWKSRRLPKKRDGYVVIERRKLGAESAARSCEWCLFLAEWGWQPYGVLPYPGESDSTWYGESCLTNCRCKTERRYIKEANLAKYVKKPFVVISPDDAVYKAFTGGEFTTTNQPDGKQFAPYARPTIKLLTGRYADRLEDIEKEIDTIGSETVTQYFVYMKPDWKIDLGGGYSGAVDTLTDAEEMLRNAVYSPDKAFDESKHLVGVHAN